MEKLKTGIIGCGGIANAKHMPTLAKLNDDVEMVAFCDIIPERAEKAAKQYGIPGARVYTDYHDLLKEAKEITDVRVCVDNGHHCEITIAALEAGKHVLCEKSAGHHLGRCKENGGNCRSYRQTADGRLSAPL